MTKKPVVCIGCRFAKWEHHPSGRRMKQGRCTWAAEVPIAASASTLKTLTPEGRLPFKGGWIWGNFADGYKECPTREPEVVTS